MFLPEILSDWLLETWEWTPSYMIERFAQRKGYSAGHGSRTARHMAEKGYAMGEHLRRLKRRYESRQVKHGGKKFTVTIALFKF